MNDNELFELCKSVYEATGWIGELYDDNEIDAWFNSAAGWTKERWVSASCLENEQGDWIPLYTSDYLLEKLPVWIDYEPKVPHLLTVQPNPIGSGWNALYRSSVATPTSARNHAAEIHEAETPLKALLKLTLELHRKGLLDAKDN